MKNELIVDNFGNREWFKNDKNHRDDGPVVEFRDGTKFWYKNGLHRIDGPAIEFSNGRREYWLNGKSLI